MNTIAETQLASLVGITTNRLRQLGAAGEIPAPVKSRYPTAQTLTALFAYYRRRAASTANDLKAQRTREAQRRADLLDLDLEERRRNLVSLQEVQKLIGDTFTPIRQTILAMPPEIAGRCNPADPVQARRALQDWVDTRFFPSIRAGMPQLAGQPAPQAPKAPPAATPNPGQKKPRHVKPKPKPKPKPAPLTAKAHRKP